MTTAKEYLSRIEEILGKRFVAGKMNLQFAWDTPEEAKQHLAQIRLMQKQLRLVKKDLNATIKMI